MPRWVEFLRDQVDPLCRADLENLSGAKLPPLAAGGRIRRTKQPELPVVIQSTSKVVTYVVLSSLREWRFEPARAGETPVAALFDSSFPPRRPLTEIANLKGSPLAIPEATLRTGRYQKASEQVGGF